MWLWIMTAYCCVITMAPPPIIIHTRTSSMECTYRTGTASLLVMFTPAVPWDMLPLVGMPRSQGRVAGDTRNEAGGDGDCTDPAGVNGVTRRRRSKEESMAKEFEEAVAGGDSSEEPRQRRKSGRRRSREAVESALVKEPLGGHRKESRVSGRRGSTATQGVPGILPQPRHPDRRQSRGGEAKLEDGLRKGGQQVDDGEGRTLRLDARR